MSTPPVPQFESLTAAPQVKFVTNGVQPPSQLYISAEDLLIISAASTLSPAEVITVNIRLLRADGIIIPIQTVLTLNTDRSVKTKSVPLTEGFLLSASVLAQTAVTRGQTFVRIFINRGGFGTGEPGQVLLADYVTTQLTPAYPGGRLLAPTDGPGNITKLVEGIPGAATDFSIPVPSNTRWRLIALIAGLSASATVGNRNVDFQVSDVASISLTTGAAASQTAGQFKQYTLTALQPAVFVDGSTVIVPMPPAFYMVNNPVTQQKINSVTTSLFTGDQWNPIILTVEEWLDNV